MSEKRDDPTAPFERRPELMEAHATPELSYRRGRWGLQLQQRWKWDDGTCAGWRDVPVFEGD